MNKDELVVVFKAAIAMARQDGDLKDNETKLINSLLEAGGLSAAEVGGFDGKMDPHPEKKVGALESVKAKRTYLLVLATVAMADGSLDDVEVEYFNQMANRLGVGTIDLKALTLDKAVATAKRIVGEASPTADGKGAPQPSDIDLM